jgi:hypothetical protein
MALTNVNKVFTQSNKTHSYKKTLRKIECRVIVVDILNGIRISNVYEFI